MIRRFGSLLSTALLAVFFFSIALSGQVAHAAKPETLNLNAEPELINRATVKMGKVWFYDNNPTDRKYVYTAVNSKCPATLSYGYIGAVSPGSDMSDGYKGANNYAELKYTVTSGSGECKQEDTKTIQSAKGFDSRRYVVFYRDGEVINSVLRDSDQSFKFYKTLTGAGAEGKSTLQAFKEVGVSDEDCPAVIRNISSWVYIPMRSENDEGKVSDQYRYLLGNNAVMCNALGDNDDFGAMEAVGIPENYYDRGTEGDHALPTTFKPMDGVKPIWGLELPSMPGKEAAGLALNGPLKGGQDLEGAKGNPGEAGGGELSTTCAIEGIGWIVCPVMNFMANIIDEAYQQVASWLTVTPISTTGGGAAMYSAWVSMRDIANVAFVIAFMIIVYSQLTSAGVSNYGIKKLLPKIVVAAILVNLSYIICTIAVDVSNIAGKSLYTLFATDSFSKGIDTSHFKGDDWSTNTGEGLVGWSGIVAAMLGSAGIIYLALPALIVALPTALLAIVTVFLVLALRQVLIILLIVISPLAFIALLLPNTEEWFGRWRKLFIALLILYPVISLLFGASALASTIVMNSATDAEDGGKISLQLMGALITILPLVLTPVLMKASSGVLNRFAGIVNDPNRGPFDAMRKRAEGLAGRIRNNRDSRAMQLNPDGSYKRPFSMRRGGLRSEIKNKNAQRRRDGWVDAATYNDPRLSKGLNKAINAEETAAEIKEATIANAKLERLDMPGVRNRQQNAFDATRNLQNRENTRKSEFDATHRRDPANAQAYQNLAAATTNAENAEKGNRLAFSASAEGRALGVQGQGLDDDIAREGAITKQAYLNQENATFEATGTSRVQSRKVAEGAAKIAESRDQLAFETSAVGKGQAQATKVQEGELQIARGDQEITYKQSTEGIQQAVQLDNIAQRQAIASDQAETAAVGTNTNVRVAAQAAKDTLEAAKSEETAFMQELRTDEGADALGVASMSPEMQAAAQQLNIADTQKRVQTQRAANAQSVATTEYAGQVEASSGISGGLADIAGGIDHYGATRAVSAATQVAIEQFNKNVATEQATMPRIHPTDSGPSGEPSLRAIALDPTQSDERRAAAAGMFMKTAPMAAIHEFIDQVGSIPDTEIGGEPGKGDEARRNILMQIKGDMNRIPFALGDGARSAIGRGDYKTADFGTHSQQLAARVQRKMSGDEWRSMDPDDRAAIRTLASTESGRTLLGTVGMNNLKGAFEDINTTPNVRTQTKVDARQEANRVAASFGFDIPFPDTDTPTV